jgi:hypothetical protein
MSEEEPQPETKPGLETPEGFFELWTVNVDADADGIPYESPRDIDIKGMEEKTVVRAMFPITKDTHGRFIQIIEGSSSGAKREGFKVNLKTNADFDPESPKYQITFDDEEKGGFLIFNAKIQQLKNILFHRRMNTVYVKHVY